MVEKRELTDSSFSTINQNIKAIIVGCCEVEPNWASVAAEIAFHRYVLELAICDCPLVDAVVEPVWSMTHLQRLSLCKASLI